MSLKYRILWVDDKIDDFKDLGYDNKLHNYLRELFFIPTIRTCETAREAQLCIIDNKYDLILSDYNIDTEKGDEFIRFVRAQSVNTEILFYSAQHTVPELDIDRISFVNLSSSMGEGYRNLFEKITKLINLTIEKLQELTTIRGLVMAETSSLDRIMEDIIDYYFIQTGTDKRSCLFNEVLDHIEASIKSSLKKAQENCSKKCSIKLREKQIAEIIHSILFESSKKAITINKIIESEKIAYNSLNNFYQDYLEEIINTRNNLAHSYSEVRNGKEILITKKPEREYFFDEESFTEIRKNIIKYQEFLNSVEQQMKLNISNN